MQLYIGENIKRLRRQKGITQETLAERMHVSTAAVSKWELGRGYPNIDSLKDIAKFFSVSLDDLLSTNEVLAIAEEDGKQRSKHFTDLILGMLDLSALMLLFLPFFAKRTENIIKSASLFSLDWGYLKVVYLCTVILTALTGAVILALQGCYSNAWLKIKAPISLSLGIVLVLTFTVSPQPYAAVYAFTLLLMKTLMLIKRK